MRQTIKENTIHTPEETVFSQATIQGGTRAAAMLDLIVQQLTTPSAVFSTSWQVVDGELVASSEGIPFEDLLNASAVRSAVDARPVDLSPVSQLKAGVCELSDGSKQEIVVSAPNDDGTNYICTMRRREELVFLSVRVFAADVTSAAG